AQTYRIKKYPNRRYYDTTRSRHVTLAGLFELVRQGNMIQVTASNSGDDISNVVLTQMILERDPPKLALFPASLLHQVIQANQQILGTFVERYFGKALDAFLQSQNQFEDFLRRAGIPDPSIETAPWTAGNAAKPTAQTARGADQQLQAQTIAELRTQLSQMSSQLAKLRRSAGSSRAVRKRPTRTKKKPTAKKKPHSRRSR
ncbi:MAG: polyhydroxyalkanoate synthesis regulator DNA-binding domain-containing protein, partial [Phycisphaerae bacterium]